MTVVYLSGPYSGNFFRRCLNIWRAWKKARTYWSEGFAVICPHTNAGFMEGAATYAEFLAGDVEILKRCDFAYMLKGWRDSNGAMRERQAAEFYGIPILYEEDK